jgi:hypothetical protein
MASTLYFLRRPHKTIDPALFSLDDQAGDVVLVDIGRDSITPDEVVRLADKTSGSNISFEDLVEMIFAHERVIVI